MSEQPTALRIAEWFEGGYGGCESEAAAELRRLHEVNQELLEVLKLALGALEYIREGANNQGPHTGISWHCVSNKAEPSITAIRAAIERRTIMSKKDEALKKALADSALDRMAENARELGLDYEPAQKQLTDEKGRPLKFWGGKAEQPAQDQGQSCYCPNCEALSKELAELKAQQQEPAAWMKDCADFWEHYTYISEASQENYKAEAQMWVEKLRTSPQPAQPSKPWVGLTDEEFEEIELGCRSTPFGKIEAMRKVEAKLWEKNT